MRGRILLLYDPFNPNGSGLGPFGSNGFMFCGSSLHPTNTQELPRSTQELPRITSGALQENLGAPRSTHKHPGALEPV